MYTILVVDDEKDIVSALEIYLKAEGYRVLAAYNGKEALSVAAHEDVHLILMDIMMPVMDGIEAVKAIRGLDREDAGTIPIFAMTAQASSENVRKCLNAGMDGHIPKPIEASKLGSTILKVKVHRN